MPSPLPRGDLSASMVVLALIVQEPDTASNLGTRLGKKFPQARWSRNAAHNNIPSLAKQGLVRLVAKGAKSSLDRYEATPDGVVRCRQWVRGLAMEPPVARDSVQGMLRFSTLEDLPAIIRSVRAEEDHCASEFGKAHADEMKARLLISQEKELDYDVKIERILLADEAAFWGGVSVRRKRLRAQLERIVAELDLASPLSEPRDG
jgi:hypothetical protein